MAKRIKYATTCFYCRKMVERGKGFLQRAKGRWYAHCDDCYNLKQEEEKKQYSE